jgi:predicted Zn-dependent protease
VITTDTTTPGFAELDLDDLRRIAQLGLAAFNDGKKDRARQLFVSLRAIAPQLHVSHHYLGLIAESDGAFEVAASCYRAATARLDGIEELAPLLDAISLRYAAMLLRLGRPAEAHAMLQARPTLPETLAGPRAKALA